MAENPSNTPELTVTELSGALKRTLEDAFGFVRVRGEVSRVSRPGSGHVYFDLKDANAVIAAVIWKGVAARLRTPPEQGLEVIATGRVTTFPGQSKYQIVVEALEPAGVGALMALLEARRKALAGEGLFEASRKKALPFLPGVVGVVTSPTGAVIRDILHRLADRFPRRVLVWPVRVQGEASAAEVAAAIAGFNALTQHGAIPRPDVLIVARGGGSLEDLWSFNEEVVVRAAAASAIPLIAAVGHETDWTLIDLAADARAPTPTAAAEMAVPVRAELMAQLRDRGGRLAAGALRLAERRRRDLGQLVRALPSRDDLVERPRQRVDLAGARLAAAMRSGLDRRALTLGRLSRRLGVQAPEARLGRLGERLDGLGARIARARATALKPPSQSLSALAMRLDRAFAARLDQARREAGRGRERVSALADRGRRAMLVALARRGERLAALDQVLRSLSYRNVLTRGFAVVRDGARRPLPRAAGIGVGDRLSIEFADGAVDAIAAPNAATAGAVPSPRKPRGGRDGGGGPQGHLF